MTALIQDTTEARPWAALERFIAAFACPEIADDGLHIVPGFADEQSLPADGNDFAVFTPITETRRATNAQEWDGVAEKITELEYIEQAWQIDFYSGSPVHAMNRAQALEQMARTEQAVTFMRALHIDLQYADGLTNLTGILDAGKYVSRWAVTVHVGYYRKLKQTQEFFTAASVDVVNVDVRFPPR